MTRLTVFLILFFIISLQVKAQSNTGLLKLKNEIQSMNEDPLFKFGQMGFSLRSSDGKVLYDFNGDKSLVPASNLKLLTTATAQKILGDDFRFETKLFYDGTLKDGILFGNLFIEGGGDPTLGSERIKGNPDMSQLFSIWTQKIKQSGITKINGSVIAVSSIFEKNSIPDGWIWTDIGNYYGAGVSGLNFNENLYKLVFKAGKSIGDPTQVIRTEPAIPDLHFDNEVKSGPSGSGDNAYIYGSPLSYFRYLEGTIPAGASEFPIKGSMPDPAFICAHLFYLYLNEHGVVVLKPSPKSNDPAAIPFIPKSSTLIYTYTSPELKEIIKYTNFYSINLYAEALLKMIAVKKGFPGDTKKGILVLKDYWKSHGMDIEGMFLYDGSGLSPQTAIRPSQMTNMLYLMSTDTVFFKSIPVAGESGTLWKFCRGTKAEKNICAKSGTLSKVICYSGYAKSLNGQLNSFSIFINNYNGSNSAVIARLEKIMVMLAEM